MIEKIQISCKTQELTKTTTQMGEQKHYRVPEDGGGFWLEGEGSEP
jgi:hypothetical protein